MKQSKPRKIKKRYYEQLLLLIKSCIVTTLLGAIERSTMLLYQYNCALKSI